MEQGSQLSPANWPDVEFGTRLAGNRKQLVTRPAAATDPSGSSGLRRHRRMGPPDELIQSRLRGDKQACLDVFDGLVLHPLGGRHEVGAGSCQGFTNR